MRSEILKNVQRIVVKVGTTGLTNEQRLPDVNRIGRLVNQLVQLLRAGKEVVLVSSGAVASGMGVLGLSKRPTELSQLQACAAVGQCRLMAFYDRLFGEQGVRVAQILVTHEDFSDHERHLNARNTLLTLLKNRIVPIVNENDTTSTAELKFGDNDRLSALVACLLPADILIILTSTNGLFRNFGTPEQERIPLVERIDYELERQARQTRSQVSVGGMVTKLQAARIATKAGIPVVIASFERDNVLMRILQAEDEGTLFLPSPSKLRSRKRWIAFFHYPKGALIVDEGARKALVEDKKSLLLPGIKRVEGTFRRGDIVSLCDEEGREFGRGVSRFDSEAIARRDGIGKGKEVVHRDDLVIL